MRVVEVADALGFVRDDVVPLHQVVKAGADRLKGRRGKLAVAGSLAELKLPQGVGRAAEVA